MNIRRMITTGVAVAALIAPAVAIGSTASASALAGISHGPYTSSAQCAGAIVGYRAAHPGSWTTNCAYHASRPGHGAGYYFTAAS